MRFPLCKTSNMSIFCVVAQISTLRAAMINHDHDWQSPQVWMLHRRREKREKALYEKMLVLLVLSSHNSVRCPITTPSPFRASCTVDGRPLIFTAQV
ncbi:hypothetical protein GGI42DRAFT_326890 [Trichoderma sp. SZMC 28013]